MATTSVSDAVVFPQDDGTGAPAGNEDYNSAGFFGTLSRNTGAEYKEGATLSNLDTTNETVDVAPGAVYVREGGNTVQSGAQSAYDTTLPEDMVYAVILPTTTTVDLDTDTSADLRLVVDPSSQDTVTIEHNTSPSNPSLVIGNVDSSSGGTADERNPGPIVQAKQILNETGRASIQARFDGLVTPIAAGAGIMDAVDPATTTTPIQDAINLIDSLASGSADPAGGIVLVPGGITEEEGPINAELTNKSHIKLEGLAPATDRYPDPPSVIKITNDDSASAIDFGYNSVTYGWEIENIQFRGTGNSSGTETPAIKGSFANCRMDKVYVTEWIGEWLKNDGGSMFQNWFGTIGAERIDAGDTNRGALIDIETGGPNNVIEQILSYPTSAKSGANSNIVELRGGHLEIGSINAGQSTGQVVFNGFGPCRLKVGSVNWEPSTINSTIGSLFWDKSDQKWEIEGPITVNGAGTTIDLNQVYTVVDESKANYAQPDFINGATVNNTPLNMATDLTGDNYIKYGGPISDVTGYSSVLTNPVVCLADISKKASTGVGYDGGTDDSQL